APPLARLHRDGDDVAARIVDPRLDHPSARRSTRIELIRLSRVASLDPAQDGAGGPGGIRVGECGEHRVPTHPIAFSRHRIDIATEPRGAEASYGAEPLRGRVDD